MSIENMLLRTYDKFTQAQEAREALIAAGFAPDAVAFKVGDDEAVPVAGSFMIDREQHPENLRRTPDFSEGYDPNEVQDTRPVDWGRSYLLMVDADDVAQHRLAAEITERFGGMDVDRMTGTNRT